MLEGYLTSTKGNLCPPISLNCDINYMNHIRKQQRKLTRHEPARSSPTIGEHEQVGRGRRWSAGENHGAQREAQAFKQVGGLSLCRPGAL